MRIADRNRFRHMVYENNPHILLPHQTTRPITFNLSTESPVKVSGVYFGLSDIITTEPSNFRCRRFTNSTPLNCSTYTALSSTPLILISTRIRSSFDNAGSILSPFTFINAKSLTDTPSELRTQSARNDR